MNILKLRFANLNSLKGEWLIDFRHPVYANEGIFAITGATGAGKSTILDAICLALYGATPRLGDITQNKNDIMSRQTGECFAEVVFSVNSNTYVVFWGQKRAYLKADGKLQSPKHEVGFFINDDEKGDWIETKAQRTKLKIEEITGMDFGRFTRAMLLAQGGFSAFLQANADERSPILEQITGTEIYSDISKKVREMFNHEKKLLESLQDKLSGFSLLSKEQEKTLQEKKNIINQQIEQQKNQIQQWQQCKIWRENLSNTQQQFEQLLQQQHDLTSQQQLFLVDEKRLERGLDALNLREDYQYYQQLNQEIQLNQQKQFKFLEQIPTLQQALLSQEQLLATALQDFQNSEKNFNEQQVVFQKVKEYDYQINHLQTQIQQLQQQIGESEQFLAQNQQVYEDKLREKSVLKQQIGDIQQQLESNKILQEIPATLLKLEHLQHNLTQYQANAEQAQQRLVELQNQQQHHAQFLQSATIKIETASQQLSDKLQKKQQVIDSFNLSYQSLNAQEDYDILKYLVKYIEQYKSSEQRLVSIQQGLDNWQNIQQKFIINQDSLASTTEALAILQQKINHNLSQQANQKQHINLLNDNILLQHKILSLENERKKLLSGEPCPLCGSTNHPYQEQNITHDFSDNDVQLQNLQQELTQLQQDWTVFSQDYHQKQAEQQHLQSEQSVILQQRQVFFQTFCQELMVLQNDFLVESWFADLALYWQVDDIDFTEKNLIGLKEYFHNLMRFLCEKIQQLEHFYAQIDMLTGEIHELERQVHDLQHQQQLYVVQKNQFSEQYQLVITQQFELSEQILQTQQSMTTLILPFCAFEPDSLSQGNFQQVIASLNVLFQQFEQQKSLLKQLDNTFILCENQLVQAKNASEHFQIQVKSLNNRLLSEQVLLRNTQQVRFEIFADKQVSQAEKQLVFAKQQFFDNWQFQQSQHHQLLQSWQSLQENLVNITQILSQKQPLFETLAVKLQQDFIRFGFADEQDFEQSLLSVDEIKSLQQRREELYQQLNLLKTQLDNLKDVLQDLIVQDLTDLSLSDICYNLDVSQSQLSSFEREMGMIEQQLQHNQDLKVSQTALLAELQQQQKVFDEWHQLDKLVGSSDGKKFRNFAQSLTFDIMINHANTQLAKMSDRYLLVADKEQALSLNVIDNYQAGIVRTSKNLSGGESFIISLALALGLSNMASHKMQVNSLFLDEGFGTLDEEALDMALDTLSSLQQSGKLIGVISHIQALKERISSKILVLPQTGGVSKIIGEGVFHLV